MTKEEYLEHHIPHRINLLITFRERYGGLDMKTRGQVEELTRDFHRCSKDISMMMVRFLLGELGIRLPEKKEGKPDDICKKTKEIREWVHVLDVDSVKEHASFKQVFKVLKAANRAVAHIENLDVDHDMKTIEDDQILIDAINYTEQMCIANMYENNARNDKKYEYHRIMNEPNNQMHRDRLDLVYLAKSY
jgi:hypothetical protein